MNNASTLELLKRLHLQLLISATVFLLVPQTASAWRISVSVSTPITPPSGYLLTRLFFAASFLLFVYFYRNKLILGSHKFAFCKVHVPLKCLSRSYIRITSVWQHGDFNRLASTTRHRSFSSSTTSWAIARDANRGTILYVELHRVASDSLHSLHYLPQNPISQSYICDCLHSHLHFSGFNKGKILLLIKRSPCGLAINHHF